MPSNLSWHVIMAKISILIFMGILIATSLVSKNLPSSGIVVDVLKSQLLQLRKIQHFTYNPREGFIHLVHAHIFIQHFAT